MFAKFCKLICSLLFISAFTIAQPLSIQWQKCLGGTYGENGFSIKQTTDGGYLSGGTAISNDGDVSGNHALGHVDYWMCKLDGNGQLVWQKCYGGSDEDFLYSMQLTTPSGFIMAGVGGSIDGDIIGMHTPGDFWIVKCDSLGTIQWQKCLGGTESDNAHKIIQSFDKGYLAFGYSQSSDFDVVGRHDSTLCPQCSDAWLVKLDSSGNQLWSKCYGGSWREVGYSIIQTTDSGYMLISSAQSNDGDVQGIHSSYDYWLVKIDSVGNIQWQKCLGGTYSDVPNDVILTNDGGYLIIGISESLDGDVTGHHGGTTNLDAWVVKVDSAGNLQWEKSLGGYDFDIGRQVLQLADGGFVALCYTYSTDGDLSANPPAGWVDVWIVRLDQTGNILWQQCFGGSHSDAGYDMQLTSDGGLIFTGTTDSNNGDVTGNNGDWDQWVVKLAPLPDGIEATENLINDFKAYPNPADEKIDVTFFLYGNEKIELDLIDITGRILLQDAFLATNGLNKHQVFTGDLVGGIYFVRLQGDCGAVTRKVIVQ